MPGTPLPVIGLAIVGGGIVIAYGVKNAKTALASTPTSSPAAASSSAGSSADSATGEPAVSIPGIPSGTAQSIIDSAASAHGVPLGVFYGMFNNETSLGANISTSSTGAVGPFQFEPSTAASYGYPLVNEPDVSQLTAQANAAATLLATLHSQFGSWESALAAYNAGPANVGAGMSYADQALAWAQQHGLPT